MADNTIAKVGYRHVQGGNVPGGHNVIYNTEKNSAPFITPMRECNSIELRHSDVVVDIGAYVGTYAIRCARFPVKKVVAYEPTKRTFDILALTKSPNMELVNAAIVPDDRNTVTFYISKGIGVTNSMVQYKRKAQKVIVPAVNYIEAVKDATIVKIDIEGGEYTLPIIQPSLRAIIIDFHPMPGDWVKSAKKIIEDIKGAGFTSVIEPTFKNGWDIGGSWIRELSTSGEFAPMVSGRLCCGCGVKINLPSKGLCKKCYSTWSKKHRKGFVTK